MFDSGPNNSAVVVSEPERAVRAHFAIAIGLAAVALIAFYFSAKGGQQHFDYTFRIADALLDGRLGLAQPAPSWLNEMVPVGGQYYSVFPLGAVLSMMPLALLHKAHLLQRFDGRVLAALLASACAFFFFLLSGTGAVSLGKRIMLALFPIFGTWTWCNLGFGGAWQVALGFALLGEVAALYFTLVKPRPFIAGVFFALAFGNRTELLLTAPVFLYLWFWQSAPSDCRSFTQVQSWLRDNWKILARFLAIPIALALGTAAYNFARFGSILDFGYARIPRLAQEPWYQHGLFSLHAIPWNVFKMFFEGMDDIPIFPFLRPHAFGCSIFLASPFLFLLFREGGKFRAVCWIAIAALTFALWCHGNPGGWQFSYRYAMILLPWMFLLILGNGPAKITAVEMSIFAVSVAINGMATYQFHWTSEIHP
jgi:hypothetical protein